MLVRLDAEPVTGVDDVCRLLDEHRIGKAVKATVVRSGGLTDIEVRPERTRALSGRWSERNSAHCNCNCLHHCAMQRKVVCNSR